jgi:GMP synthase-like glutamine amidotransferase
MKILVLQHIASEHLGVFGDFLHQDELNWQTIELDEGQEIPELEPYDLMIVMGGPQDVWQEDQYTWLRTEKAASASRRGHRWKGCSGEETRNRSAYCQQNQPG